jgi:EmrB/QacA subfamily drug resistance transporter
VLVVLSAVSFMAQLDVFIVNVSLPAMAHSFAGSTLGGLSWVLNAYTIVFAALLVPAGRLADHLGRRRVLLLGTVAFTLASALCAIAPTLPVLVVGRAVQAIGAAMIVPTSLGLLLPSFPRHQHNMVVGTWAAVGAVAGASGPTIGGLLIAVNWRWIYLVNVPIGVLVVIGGLIVLPEVRAGIGSKLPDTVSVVAVLYTIAMLALATVQGPTWGWSSPSELLLIAGFVVGLAISLWRIRTVSHAVIEPALFRYRDFTVSTVALLLFFVNFAAWLLVSIQFLEEQWGYSPLRAGLALAPGPATAMVCAIISGRLANRFGRRVPASIGAIAFVVAAAYWVLITKSSPEYVVGYLPGTILGGVAAGFIQAPLLAAASSLPHERATTGSAVLNMARQVGSALGVAIFVALLAGHSLHQLSTYDRAWLVMAIIGVLTVSVIAIGLPRRSRAATEVD